MGIHIFHCVHGGEKITSHDVMQDAFVAIAKDAGFHVSPKQTHVLSSPALQFSRH
jgi:hypothetical protein